MGGYVYILASKRGGTLYTGVSADLARRVWEHKQHLSKGFTSRYGAVRLVWSQEFFDIGDAILYEKKIKRWRRAWKIRLIEEMNPDWRELYGGMGWQHAGRHPGSWSEAEAVRDPFRDVPAI
ncbi:GIY-YIG nuclease family protein [Nitratireductor sp. GCM10026969]|uniref:GIY-YIG nuclease family protein n=1 Tax=Nitratireductor sp. GCM10026969 TaxID=3252645 RepID=UPI00361B6C3B